MTSETDEAIDIVYTWVDDNFPGYADQLAAFARKPQDRNPNRTRDNLDLLKYGLRSLARFVPWARNVYVVSCTPQIPRWMKRNAPGLRIVHHDTFMDAAVLPSFNSFAIVSFLAQLPGLSQRFLYVEDDMLFGRPVSPADFMNKDGHFRFQPRLVALPDASLHERDDFSPWTASLAYTNHLLDAAFRKMRRSRRAPGPLFIDRAWWGEMVARWPAEFVHTRASRFRSKHNVAPEYLYPYFLLHTDRARSVPLSHSYRDTYYLPLENFEPLMRIHLFTAQWLQPKFLTLNDGFGAVPNPRVVTLAREFLERNYPNKSRFEL